MPREVWFALPGDPNAMTGGYIYDRMLVRHLPEMGWRPRLLLLPAAFPYPSPDDLQTTRGAFAALPKGAVVLADGLAFGALPREVLDSFDLTWVALVHHPLAAETGLSSAQAAHFRDSEQAALAAARIVVVTSPHTAAVLSREYGVARDRVHVAVPGTDAAPRAPGNGDPPLLFTAATLTRRKAHDVLVRALADVRPLRWRAVFAGSETHEPDTAKAVRDLIRALDLGERIVLRGELTGAELDKAYAEADIFVLPSRYEGFGMAFAEALARGIPIVGCATGAVFDTVPEGAGVLVGVDDVTALAGTLRRLLSNRVERRAMSDAAWAHGQTLARWPDTAARVAAALESVHP